MAIGFSPVNTADFGVFTVCIELDINVRQRLWMSQSNQVSSFLGGHDGGNSGNTQYITFFGGTTFNKLEGGRLHMNISGSNGKPVCSGFFADIDHVGITSGVKMG